MPHTDPRTMFVLLPPNPVLRIEKDAPRQDMTTKNGKTTPSVFFNYYSFIAVIMY